MWDVVTRFLDDVAAFLTNATGRSLYVVSALLLFVVVQKGAAALVNSSRRRLERYQGISRITVNFWLSLLYYSVLAAALVAALRIAGISSVSILTGAGITGLVIAFATQNVLSNLFAGALILVQKPFDIGHWVSVGSISGTVVGINLLSTTVLTLEQQLVMLPNKLLLDGPIVNASANSTRLWNFSFYVDCWDKAAEVKDRLLDVVRADPRVLEPPSGYSELTEKGTRIVLRALVKNQDLWPFHFEMQPRITEVLKEAGCIPIAMTGVQMLNKHE